MMMLPISLVALGLSFALGDQGLATPSAPIPNMSCQRSPLAIGSQWPVDTTDRAHMVIDIERLVSQAGTTVGWLYHESNGDEYLQAAARTAAVAEAFAEAGTSYPPATGESPAAIADVTRVKNRSAIFLTLTRRLRFEPCFSSSFI